MTKKVAGRIAVSAVIVLAVLFLLQRLFMPKYAVGIKEGTLTGAYYQEKEEHDVVFIGDCEVYSNYSPVLLWQEQGISSTLRGTAQQMMWQSYYMLEDTLRYETPKVVVLNISAMSENESSNKEEYNRMALEGMKWSSTKINAIKTSMLEGEHFIDYVFPIFRYHSRWSDLTADDVTYMFSEPTVSHNGFLMQTAVKPAENIPSPRPLADYQFSETNYEYLDKITALCSENGIQLILVKAPSLYPYWYPEWDAQMQEYAAEHDLLYFNFIDRIDEIGLDFTQDTFDSGLHLNVTGAEKLTHYFGRYLAEYTEARNQSLDLRMSSIWAEKVEAYYEDKAAMYEAQAQENTNP